MVDHTYSPHITLIVRSKTVTLDGGRNSVLDLHTRTSFHLSLTRSSLTLKSKAPKKAKRRGAAAEGGSSNVFSMFEQSQIQEYKEAFTIIDQNRDGIISKDDLRDVLASMGQLNVKNEELEAMVKEASGPINFTVFLTMFGEKLKGADPEDVIVSAFKVLDPDATGFIKKDFLQELLTTQCDRFSAEEMKNLWAAFPPDVAGNVDYKQICYVITHGEEKEE
uniref:EF-hand domain-containing protein n=1 Tax=Oncorhynchus tshawytscha TaxID=74940 RepID=A0A8C8D2P3_ONCTS